MEGFKKYKQEIMKAKKEYDQNIQHIGHNASKNEIELCMNVLNNKIFAIQKHWK